MARGTYDKTSPRIGFHNWNLDTFNEEAVELFNRAFKEALDLASEQYECDAVFGFENDELVLRVSVPLGAEEYEDPTWVVSVALMIAEVINLEDSTTYIEKVRDELRRFADLLDAHLK